MQRPDTLGALLAGTIAQRPSGPAVTDSDGTLGWPQFAALVEGLAGRLGEAGVGADERVALWLPNSADYLALIFACARLSALAVHVNTRFRNVEVGYLLRRSRATVLITEWGFESVDFPAVFASLPEEDTASLRLILGRRLPAHAASLAGVSCAPLAPSAPAPDRATAEAPCLTFTTSGTTSGPKLVLHRQRTIAGHAFDAMARMGTADAGSAILAAVPFCGTFGHTAALAGLAGGAHIVCMDRFDASRADALIRRHRITHVFGGDDMLGKLAEAADGAPHTSVRLSGFAAFSPAAEASIAAAEAAGLAPRGLYGSSEVQALFAFAPDEDRLTAGGKPSSAQAEFAVRDPDTGEPMAEGQSGELHLRAPSQFAGYLDNEEATRAAVDGNGWFRTGDRARSDGCRFIFEGRLGDSLRLGGFLVSPDEIEGFIQTLDGVAGAQVVAVERGAERIPVAFVTLRAGASFDEGGLLAVCRGSLARYKVPARIFPIGAFPTTESPNGIKIQRSKLRERAAFLLEGAAEVVGKPARPATRHR